MNFRITFHLDGTGIVYYPDEPIHIDALLAWALAPHQGINPEGLTRDGTQGEVQLPLLRRSFGEHWVWAASALAPDGVSAETLAYWRKRFRRDRIAITDGAPNTQMGRYRDWNTPIMPLLCTRMVGYASGNRKECKKILKDIRALGKKRAHGYGKVIGVDLDEIEHDWSCVRDGVAMRWLPDSAGTRYVRLHPPYWHPHERVTCCEVGAPFHDGAWSIVL